MLVRSYYHAFHVPVLIARCNNVYGPNQYSDKVIPLFLDRLRKGLRCPLHGSGEQQRSFIHVEDVFRAVVCILERGAVGEAYNIGSQEEHSIVEVVAALLRALRRPAVVDDHVERIADRPYNDKRYLIDDTKLRRLGWSEQCVFANELERLVDRRPELEGAENIGMEQR